MAYDSEGFGNNVEVIPPGIEFSFVDKLDAILRDPALRQEVGTEANDMSNMTKGGELAIGIHGAEHRPVSDDDLVQVSWHDSDSHHTYTLMRNSKVYGLTATPDDPNFTQDFYAFDGLTDEMLASDGEAQDTDDTEELTLARQLFTDAIETAPTQLTKLDSNDYVQERFEELWCIYAATHPKVTEAMIAFWLTPDTDPDPNVLGRAYGALAGLAIEATEPGFVPQQDAILGHSPIHVIYTQDLMEQALMLVREFGYDMFNTAERTYRQLPRQGEL